jgi:hypothetical protein
MMHTNADTHYSQIMYTVTIEALFLLNARTSLEAAAVPLKKLQNHATCTQALRCKLFSYTLSHM